MTQPRSTDAPATGADATLPFALVDVFATAPLTGNPLAVVGRADRLSDDTMQRLAREFNQAETTFVLSPRRPAALWRLRSFTAAGVEVFGAGHNSLGAWWWLAASGQVRLEEETVVCVQEIGDAVLPVEIAVDAGAPSTIALTQAAPTFGHEASEAEVAALARALGLTPSDFLLSELPPQVVSTGTAHLMVPIRDRAAVARAQPDHRALVAILATFGGEGCYLASLDPLSARASAHTRFFNPTAGLYEDSATGTAAGPLVCYLRARGRVDDGATIIVEQGHAMNRPSEIRVMVDGARVVISGSGVVVADGVLHL